MLKDESLQHWRLSTSCPVIDRILKGIQIMRGPRGFSFVQKPYGFVIKVISVFICFTSLLGYVLF